jgi:hypothetical protein
MIDLLVDLLVKVHENKSKPKQCWKETQHWE